MGGKGALGTLQERYLFECLPDVILLELPLVLDMDLLNLSHVSMRFNIFISTLSLNFAIFQNDDVVCKMDEINSVGN